MAYSHGDDMRRFRKQKHIEGSIMSCQTKGFSRGDIIVVSGSARDGEYRIKDIEELVLAFGPVRWYHRILPIVRAIMTVIYWWFKIQGKKLSVWRLSRGQHG